MIEASDTIKCLAQIQSQETSDLQVAVATDDQPEYCKASIKVWDELIRAVDAVGCDENNQVTFRWCYPYGDGSTLELHARRITLQFWSDQSLQINDCSLQLTIGTTPLSKVHTSHAIISWQELRKPSALASFYQGQSPTPAA